MKLFSKVNEYNSLLEKILENKYFNSNTKNLILSMIYKIENSYNDYYTVKRIKKDRESFILEIINTIDEYANIIEFADPNTEYESILKKNNVLAVTNEKNGNILSYRTEISLLYAISDLKPKYFFIKNNFVFKTGFHKILVYGYNKNNVEVLTDFNGWSWDTDNKYYNYTYNLIYQNLLTILGVKFLDQWLNYNSNKIDFIDNIKSRIKNTNYFFWLCRIIYLSEKHNDSFIKNVNKKIDEYKKISNKDKYLENVRLNRIKLTKAVKKIDLILNDEDILIKEFKKKNDKLEDLKKIKTIKKFRKILEDDREDFLVKIREMSEELKPQNYIKKKDELEFYKIIVENEENINSSIINLQKEFIKLLNYRLNIVKTNEDLIDIIYQLRYYKSININENLKIKDCDELKSLIEKLEKRIITLSCKNAILRIFSMDINLNFEIINNSLNTKIMELEQIKLKIDYDKENINVEVYDKEVFEKQFTLSYSGNKKDIEVRKNKMINLFV